MAAWGSFLPEEGGAGDAEPGRKTSRSSALVNGGAHCSEKTTRCAEWSTLTWYGALGPFPVSVSLRLIASEAVLPLRRDTSVNAKLLNIVLALTSMNETPDVSKEMFVSRV